MANEPKKQQQIQIKYEDMAARYANQVVLTTGQEEIFLDFSSGLVPDQGQGFSTLPIHTRIAMTPSGVVRLAQLLAQTVQRFQVVQVQPPPQEPPAQVEGAAAPEAPAKSE